MKCINKPFCKVIKLLDGQSSTAEKLGISQSLVSHIKTGKRSFPVKLFDKTERATNGAITRQELRPDIFN